MTAYDVAKLHNHQAVCDELNRHSKPGTKAEITTEVKELLSHCPTMLFQKQSMSVIAYLMCYFVQLNAKEILSYIAATDR